MKEPKKEYYICIRTKDEGIWLSKNPYRYIGAWIMGPYTKFKANWIISRITPSHFERVVKYQELKLRWEFEWPCWAVKVMPNYFRCICVAGNPMSQSQCQHYHSAKVLTNFKQLFPNG